MGHGTCPSGVKQALQLCSVSPVHHWDPTTKTENWGMALRGDGCQRGLGNTWRRFGREVAARKDDNRSKDKNTPEGKDALRTLRLKKDQSRRKRQTVLPLHLLLKISHQCLVLRK